MNAVERVKSICKERKIPISKLESDCGFANGYISQLRKGVFPDDRILKIAEYLNVSVDYLMTGTEKSYSEYDAILDARISEDAELKEAIKKYYSLDSQKKKHILETIDLLWRTNESGSKQWWCNFTIVKIKTIGDGFYEKNINSRTYFNAFFVCMFPYSFKG